MRRAPDPCLQGVDRLEALKRLRRLCFGDIERVHVRVDKTRDDRASTAVDHSRAAADIRLDVVVRSDCDEPPVAGGKRRGLPKALVDRQDLRVAQHEIGRRRRLIRLRQGCNEGGEREADADLRHHLSHRSRLSRTNPSSARCGYAASTRSISRICPGLRSSFGSRHQRPASNPWRRRTS